jgi:hypothetical protein
MMSLIGSHRSQAASAVALTRTSACPDTPLSIRVATDREFDDIVDGLRSTVAAARRERTRDRDLRRAKRSTIRNSGETGSISR